MTRLVYQSRKELRERGLREGGVNGIDELWACIKLHCRLLMEELEDDQEVETRDTTSLPLLATDWSSS